MEHRTANDFGAGDAERGGYTGPERRRCPKDGYCINLSDVKIELEGHKQRNSAEYAALERLVNELRELVVALPKEVAGQIEKDRHEVATRIERERKEVDHTLDKSSEDFKELFRRMGNVEKAVLVMYIIGALVIVGKGLAWLLGVLHIL